MRYLHDAVAMLARISSARFRRLLATITEDADSVVALLLQDFSIRPLVIGGLAVQRYGYQRFTEDIDLLLSEADFATLDAAGKINGRYLSVRPGLRVEVLVEGEYGLPSPDSIRSGTTMYPTLAGLIYLKMLSQRKKDEADVVELLKLHRESKTLQAEVRALLPEDMHEDFMQLLAISELETAKDTKRR